MESGALYRQKNTDMRLNAIKCFQILVVGNWNSLQAENCRHKVESVTMLTVYLQAVKKECREAGDAVGSWRDYL